MVVYRIIDEEIFGFRDSMMKAIGENEYFFFKGNPEETVQSSNEKYIYLQRYSNPYLFFKLGKAKFVFEISVVKYYLYEEGLNRPPRIRYLVKFIK